VNLWILTGWPLKLIMPVSAMLPRFLCEFFDWCKVTSCPFSVISAAAVIPPFPAPKILILSVILVPLFIDLIYCIIFYYSSCHPSYEQFFSINLKNVTVDDGKVRVITDIYTAGPVCFTSNFRRINRIHFKRIETAYPFRFIVHSGDALTC